MAGDTPVPGCVIFVWYEKPSQWHAGTCYEGDGEPKLQPLSDP